MILRAPRMTREDIGFVVQCYEDWPDTDRGPVLDYDARSWIKMWNRGNVESCLIGEENGNPVGLVTFLQNLFVAVVYEIVVHPSHRGMGNAKRMWVELQDILRTEGVVVCEFDALPGAITDKVLKGDFEKVGEGVGLHTGLPTVRGRVFADTPIA